MLLRPDRQSQLIGVNDRLTGFVEDTNFQRVHARFLNFVKTLQIYGEYAHYAGRNRETNCPNSTSILPTTILKQSFVDGAQYLLLFLSQGDHTSESKAALGIA